MSHPQTPGAGTGRLGERFVREGLLTPAQVDAIVQLQGTARIRFGEAALRLGLLTQDQLMSVLSEQFNYATASAVDPAISPLLAIARQPFGAEAESVRQLRATVAMRLLSGGRDHASITVTSPDAQEGKSYVAASLAVAFSQNGQRTLLVNGNLRPSGQTDLFGLAGGPSTDVASARHGGLSTLLARLTSTSQIVSVPGFPNLDVLPAGPQPPNPLELLAEPRLRQTLDAFGREYALLVIDTPAALASSDASLIARQTDTCLLIGRKDRTRVRALRDAEAQLRAAGADLLGAVYCTLPGDAGRPARRRWPWSRSPR